MNETKIVYKPWGKEEWIELNENYCYKRIYINAGYKTSFQYHNFKRETNYLISGTAEIRLDNDKGETEKIIMNAGDFFNITPPKKHRVIAITDIILQEVSTPHVDDIIRIEDDTNRKDGKIENEHKTPAILIIAAGEGSRLKDLTKNINKALIPINNKAVISYIIDKFPNEYEFVVALGYKGESLKDYCNIVYPDKKFIFVDVDNINGENSGPGYSALKCKEYLQRPFYITTVDCIIDGPLPNLDGNWLGIYPTAYPEKYSTVNIDKQDNIIEFVNKNEKGFDHAFIGLACIRDYDIFWSELENNIKNGDIVSAFENPYKYSNFKSKHLQWLDTGTLDDLNRTKEYFKDSPLSLSKNTGEITYRENKNRFIKFSPDKKTITNKSTRAKLLNQLIPSGFGSINNFIHYDWKPGKTLYNYDSYDLYANFLDYFNDIIKSDDYIIPSNSKELIDSFYFNKTMNRKEMFINKHGNDYVSLDYVINGIKYPSLNTLMKDIDISILYNNPFYVLFHGDLQFDNILYDEKSNKFTYIDWRESFSDYVDGGDIYYDLAKLYGGCIIPYNIMKDESLINYSEGSTIIDYSYPLSENLKKFKTYYEAWIIEKGFDLDKVKLITGLIFLNMSPLHDEKFSKILCFKSIEMLHGNLYK